MKTNILSLILICFVAGSVSAQVVVGDIGYPIGSEFDCTSDITFQDPGAGGNYLPDADVSTTFCPSLACGLPGIPPDGTKMTVAFATNAGFTWDVHGTDTVYVYDGVDATAPLLGAINSSSDPNGATYTATWDNPSGCLTVRFVSNGADEGTGWDANVSCGFVNQPFDPHIEAYVNGSGPDALNPADTGFVDICFGDSVLFVAKPDFPYSCESNGYGYTQTLAGVNFDWYITDGSTYPDNDSIWFKPLTRNGFLVDLKISDLFPQVERMLCKVRVSQLPIFAGTGPLSDTVCLGENTTLVGGVTPTDTVGVNIPGGAFQLGGSFAGLTYLPDGSGAQYAAPITIGGFPTGSTMASSQDLNQVCITMEHSYVGDLEIALECPNGTQVTLLNSYNPGFIAGGTSGGTTYMGDPIDDAGGGGPGDGWEYCFSSVFNTWGDYPTELGAGNTIPAPNFGGGGPSLNPNGVYLPENDFADFAGCPVNGQWTIIVQDNLGTDDGYIFEWGLYFDPSFFPGTGGYQNTAVSDAWLDDPTIVSGQSDTAIVVQPTTTGVTNYTYTVIDDFGCDYDTTVALFVMEQPAIFTDTIGCNLFFLADDVTSFQGGVWSSTDTEITFTGTTVDFPGISASAPGTYQVTYTDNACNQALTSTIYFPGFPYTYLADTTVCAGVTFGLNAPNDNSDATTYTWSNGDVGSSINLTEPGTYTVELNNVCHSFTTSMEFENKLCEIIPPNVISLADGSQNPEWYVTADGLSDFEVFITNRWGNVMYECSGTADPTNDCRWDGTDKTGKKVAQGTYFYVINAKAEGNQKIQQHGFIEVIR